MEKEFTVKYKAMEENLKDIIFNLNEEILLIKEKFNEKKSKIQE